MTREEAIPKAVKLLSEAATPKRIILFGSHARGEGGEESDVDLLVVEASVSNPIAEMVRLRRLLSPLRIPVEVLVVSEDSFRYWSDTPGNVLYEAAVEGKILYEAS